MKRVNFEFKARLKDEKQARAVLKRLRARFVGIDRQVDTYFRVPGGRLKVREGRIENALVFYRRTNSRRARRASVEILLLPRRTGVRSLLAAALGVRAVVRKRREIYFAGNVKIHLDRVPGLGKFLEVEAISNSGNHGRLRQQARRFQKLFGVRDRDVIPFSYADLVRGK